MASMSEWYPLPVYFSQVTAPDAGAGVRKKFLLIRWNVQFLVVVGAIRRECFCEFGCGVVGVGLFCLRQFFVRNNFGVRSFFSVRFR